jgi:hypothetical protein
VQLSSDPQHRNKATIIRSSLIEALRLLLRSATAVYIRKVGVENRLLQNECIPQGRSNSFKSTRVTDEQFISYRPRQDTNTGIVSANPGPMVLLCNQRVSLTISYIDHSYYEGESINMSQMEAEQLKWT